MSTAKITISLHPNLLTGIDALVKTKRYASRSQAIQDAVQDKLARLKRTRLAEECGKLDPLEEQALADLGLPSDLETWPPY